MIFYFCKMKNVDRKNHWENVFKTKDTTQVSWYQPKPETSLNLIKNLGLTKSSRIIEIGSGDSFLADYLLQEGFKDITLLDISDTALNTIKQRLKKDISKLAFLAADVTDFSQKQKYNVWHDRAVFHFLTDEKDIQKYVQNASDKLIPGGYLIVSTFSTSGPDMCSGLKIRQYSEVELTNTFKSGFNKLECFTENHQTPSGSIQNFIFCVFQKI